jgi:YfiH family protein
MNIKYWNIDSSLIAGTTLREGGHSKTPYKSNNMAFYVGDKYEDVLSNRKDLALTINIPLEYWVFPKITHSNNIHKVTLQDLAKGSLSEENSLMNVDALYTELMGVVLPVFHADCIPILLFDPTSKLIGVIHAGWVGTLSKITTAFIHQWINQEHVNPKDILVYIGPALSMANFQVKDDVIQQVTNKTPEFLPYLDLKSKEEAYFDAVGMNIHQLLTCGVSKNNITYLNECTYDNPDLYYSYRKEKITGRNISFIVRKPL